MQNMSFFENLKLGKDYHSSMQNIIINAEHIIPHCQVLSFRKMTCSALMTEIVNDS